MEAIKILAGAPLAKACLREKLLLYDALDGTQPCRTMNIRRNAECTACSERVQANGSFASVSAPMCGIPQRCEFDVAPEAALVHMRGALPTVILDVRPRGHFAVSHLLDAQNWPIAELARSSAQRLQSKMEEIMRDGKDAGLLLCVCRRGIDSIVATNKLRAAGIEAWNLRGGLQDLLRISQHEFKGAPLV
eukprot:gnl/MRDRNA2_/MRDRNA2_44775_c0_seq1.p1 gnl/MRDRNA2_/MRDRNA2_44775_c0~~gnl/MRDRNA2_/MRDRNA2_44775_c0_seq1.p1  ORF type:complete len:207 (-),score=35.67 gnl/MRDRNA2_/MRDRNA2_44775_c0_seq1:6-578(-)